ncbi:hypothetical protein CGCSCA5_v010083 [Colletotrichum siamense]|nr:hypothetical protein CGCSCA5_v010083 [Colletotrichum siamense]KAF4874090.1 hypothetical protein CGCSCA1_v006733 [Colletotrichum siamense]
MHIRSQVFPIFITLLFAGLGVQAACTSQSPGTAGFNGGKCNSDKVLCGQGGTTIICCDTAACV